MAKKIIIGILLATVFGSLFYYYSHFIKPDGSKIPPIYGSIDIYSKDKETLFGSIRIKNDKIVSTVTDNAIKSFINTNKSRWETSKLKHATGGMTKTGALWDGVVETSISDKKNHIISIYTILDDKYGDDFYINLVEESNDK